MVTVLRRKQAPRMELASTAVLRQHTANTASTTNSSITSGNNSGNSNRSSRRADNSTYHATTVLPLPPLLYAVSLLVHQPILSAIGSYDLGNDLDVDALGGTYSFIPLNRLCHTAYLLKILYL